jgi:tryptophan-rich sensory protein
MNKKNILILIGFIVISEVAGVVGSFFTTPAITSWYSTLEKPLFNPPNWVFAPVWTILFLLMGIAAYLVYTKVEIIEPIRKSAISMFSLQLVLNILWSILFFGQHSTFFALLEIIILWVAILYTIILFFRISKTAGWIMLPYILWVTFATYLNFQLWFLN